MGKIENTRELKFPGWPYILVYRVKTDTIIILHIYHGAQEHGAQDWP